MIHRMFCVYDAKACTFCAPFNTANSSVAIRHFAFAANDKTTDVGKYPDDFTLYEIGTYDDNSGVMEPITPPINHGLASQFITETKNAS